MTELKDLFPRELLRVEAEALRRSQHGGGSQKLRKHKFGSLNQYQPPSPAGFWLLGLCLCFHIAGKGQAAAERQKHIWSQE